MFDNLYAFFYVDKDLKIVYKISNKFHIDMVLLMNEYSYVVLNHLMLQMIFHIPNKNNDDELLNFLFYYQPKF